MHVCNRYPKQLSKTELLAWHGREKKTTSDKLWKLKWFSVISSVPRWHSSLCWTAALTVTTYNLLWCLRFELFEVTMKVQLWSSGLEMASRWWNKDTFEPLKRHNFNSLEAGRVEESPGQDPRPLICARTFTNPLPSVLSSVSERHAWLGQRSGDSLRKFGDLMEILEVLGHFTSVLWSNT